MNEVVKKIGKVDLTELTDDIATLQVERSQRWNDLTEPTTIALLNLVDTNRTDIPERTTRLTITKQEKASLLKYIDDHFPEFKNGTLKAQWSEPAKTAQLYFKIFEGRKCSDE
jgi:hypothetical protein